MWSRERRSSESADGGECLITLENESAGVLSEPVTCRWFNMPYMQKLIVTGQHLVIFGRPKKKGQKIFIDHPEFEDVEEDEETSIHMNRITPVHPAGDGVSPRLLRTLIFQALAKTDLTAVPSLLPTSRVAALRDIHFPATFEDLKMPGSAWCVRNSFPFSC